MTIESFLFCGVFVALVSAFMILLAAKLGIIEWLQVHAPTEFLYKLFSCKFCCSWWVSVGISLILSIATGHWYLLAIPFCSTVITRGLW